MANASSPLCTNLEIVGINHRYHGYDLRVWAKQLKNVKDIKAKGFNLRDALIS